MIFFYTHTHTNITNHPRWWFQKYVLFSRQKRGRWTQFDEHIFSDGLKPPTSIALNGNLPGFENKVRANFDLWVLIGGGLQHVSSMFSIHLTWPRSANEIACFPTNEGHFFIRQKCNSWIYPSPKSSSHTLGWVARWWFQTFFIFTRIWGRFPIWLIFFKWVETTN